MSATPNVQYGTVKQHFDACVRTYREKVLDSTLDSTDPIFQSIVAQLTAELELVWHTVVTSGVLSPNDELDDVSTGTLSLLLAPFLLADLHQRVVVPAPSRPSQNATSSSSSVGPAVASSRTRSHSLALSLHHLNRFLQVAVQLGLTTEQDVEQSIVYQPQQRQRKVEMSRAISGYQSTLRSMEHRMAFLVARRKRMQKLIAEEDSADDEEETDQKEAKARAAAGRGGDAVDDDAERGAEEDELLREYHLLRLRCAVLESYQSIQLSTRELEMLTTLSDEQRREIVHEYQRQMQESGGGLGLNRQTYTILPGGSIAPGAVGLRQSSSSSGGGAHPQRLLSQQHGITVDGRTVRETIQSEIFMDRNRPTMTLQEFAELEMREIQRQMDDAQEKARWQAEEDAQLGVEGIEERERKKDSAWADWKDDNPPIGLSTKGNYS